MRVADELAGSNIESDFYGLPQGDGFSSDPKVKELKITGVPTAVVFVDDREGGRISADGWKIPELHAQQHPAQAVDLRSRDAVKRRKPLVVRSRGRRDRHSSVSRWVASPGWPGRTPPALPSAPVGASDQRDGVEHARPHPGRRPERLRLASPVVAGVEAVVRPRMACPRVTARPAPPDRRPAAPEPRVAGSWVCRSRGRGFRVSRPGSSRAGPPISITRLPGGRRKRSPRRSSASRAAPETPRWPGPAVGRRSRWRAPRKLRAFATPTPWRAMATLSGAAQVRRR